MLRRLRLRLTLLSALTTAAILCVSIALIFGAFERRLMENARAAFEGSLSTAIYQIQNEQVVSWNWLTRLETSHQLMAAVADNGALLRYPGAYRARTGREALFPLLLAESPPGTLTPEGIRYASRRFTLTGQRGERYLAAAVAIPAGSDVRTLYLIQDLQGFELGGVRWACLIAALMGTLALTLLCWWLSGRMLSPVAESWRQQSAFVAAASHELRSPLGVLRASAAALAEEADIQTAGGPCGGIEGRSRFARVIDQECARLGRLVEDLLTLANADAGRLSLRPGPVEPEALLLELALLCQPAAAGRGISLELLPCGALPVITADEERLRQLLMVLIDNALQYTPSGGTVRLSAGMAGRRVFLRVADNGPGIPAYEREKVFLRFYRADRARGGQEHYGLGLAIAADIARLHGGTLALSETPGGGLTACYEQAVTPPELRS